MTRDIAVTLLNMMGHSGTVPSAIRGADAQTALARLNQGLAAAEPADGKTKSPRRNEHKDEPEPVGLKLRAFPLIQMLTAAAAQSSDVTWEEGAPLV